MEITKVLVASTLLMFLMTGCFAPKTHFVKTDLLYNPSNSKTAHISGNSTVIYIKKPDTDILKKFAESNNIKNEYSNKIVGQLATGNDEKKFLYYTNDDIGDWIAGALGTELNSIGYSVRYVENIPEGVNNSIIIKANKIFSTLEVLQMRGFSCRGFVDLNFQLLKNGIVSEEFNVKNERDCPEYATAFGVSNNPKNTHCYSGALRETLSEVLKRALPVIEKTFGEQ